MRWDGSDVIADNSISTTYSVIFGVGIACVFRKGLRAYAAKDVFGYFRYVNTSLGDIHETYSCKQDKYTLLAQIWFAFRKGKTVDDLSIVSIRC